MIKKVTAILLALGIVMSVCTSCQGNTKDTEMSHDKQKDTEMSHDKQIAQFIKEQFPFIETVYYIGQSDEYKSIVDICPDGNYFITEAGDLFCMGYFSNGSNTKRIDTQIKAQKFSFGCVVDEHNKLYYYDEASNGLKNDPFDVCYLKIPRGVPNEDYLNTAFINENPYGEGNYYYLNVKENNLFLSVYKSDESQENLIYTFDNDEEIEYIIDCSIKTNKRFYWFEIVENMSEYDDVETTYFCDIHPVDITVDGIKFIKCSNYNGIVPVIHVVDNEGNLYECSYMNPKLEKHATKIEV